jgi:hypothetical protein
MLTFRREPPLLLLLTGGFAAGAAMFHLGWMI